MKKLTFSKEWKHRNILLYNAKQMEKNASRLREESRELFDRADHNRAMAKRLWSNALEFGEAKTWGIRLVRQKEVHHIGLKNGKTEIYR